MKFKQIELQCSKDSSKKEEYQNNKITYSKDYKYISDLIKQTIPINSKILELGGGGIPSMSYLLSDYNITFSDYSKEMVSCAKRKLTSNNVKIDCLIIDAEKIPSKEESFDVTLICSSLHHLPNINKGMKEMTRITKEDGFIILAHEPNRFVYRYLYQKPVKLVKKILGIKKGYKTFSIADSNIDVFTLKDFRKYAEDNNLKIIKIYRHDLLDGYYAIFINYINYGFKFNFKASSNILHVIDKFLVVVPILNKLAWNYTVIYKKEKTK